MKVFLEPVQLFCEQNKYLYVRRISRHKTKFPQNPSPKNYISKSTNYKAVIKYIKQKLQLTNLLNIHQPKRQKKVQNKMHNVQIRLEQFADQRKEAKRIVNGGVKLPVNDKTKTSQI